MSTQVSVEPFYCKSTKSSSIRIKISYPNSISNLSYNFELHLSIFIQILLPRINYSQVHKQVIMLPKTQIIVNSLQPAKMYKLQVQWNKKSPKPEQNLHDSKTVFVCSQKIPQQDQIESQSFEEVIDTNYHQFVKDNIQEYFNQYRQNKQINQDKKFQQSKLFDSSQKLTQKQENRLFKSTRKAVSKQLCNSESIIKVIGQSDPFINRKNIQKYILESRKSSSIKDYLATKDIQCFNNANKMYKNQVERRKHVEKTLLVAKSINMFADIYYNDQYHEDSSLSTLQNQNGKGRQFFKNDWFMGPFYSYDLNEKQMKKKDS